MSASESEDRMFKSLCGRKLQFLGRGSQSWFTNEKHPATSVWPDSTKKLDWSSRDINFEQRKRLTHRDDSKHCVPFYSSPKSLIGKKNRNGKDLNRPHSLTDKASDFESEDWGFQSLCGRNFWIHCRKEVKDPKRSPKRKKWSQEIIITQRTKDGKSETTEHIEGHFTHQLIHWL